MLSKDARPIIQATLPIVKEHGATITKHFYSRMLHEHPTLKNLFNMANQENSAQSQALASAVYGYAANLDHPEITEAILERIAHKHVSLGFEPALYIVIGRHLIAAIDEVLGASSTRQIIAAWDEVYWLMATDLMTREARIYQDLGWKAGQDWQTLRITGKSRASENATALTLSSLNGKPLPDFKPGQYISIAINVPALGLTQRRQYSLTNMPGDGNWRICVKHEVPQNGPPGTISSIINDQLKTGDTLLAGPPAGNFVLPSDDHPLVMLSAGIGVTPFLSMLKAIRNNAPTRRVIFAHANTRSSFIPHTEELDALRRDMPNLEYRVWLEQESTEVTHSGLMDVSTLAPFQENAAFYLCGPLPFMQSVRRQLLHQDVNSSAIHYEAFGPDVFGSA